MRTAKKIQWSIVAVLLLTFSGCWNVKDITGRDCLNLGKLNKKNAKLVSPILITDIKPDKNSNKYDEQLLQPMRAINSIPVYVNNWLAEHLVIGDSTLPDVIDLLGEPEETLIEQDRVILVYYYKEGFKKGHYRVSTRKLETKGKLAYFITIVISNQQGIGSRNIKKELLDPLNGLSANKTPTAIPESDFVRGKLIRDKLSLPNGFVTDSDSRKLMTISAYKFEIDLKGDREDKFDPLRIGGNAFSGGTDMGKKALKSAL